MFAGNARKPTILKRTTLRCSTWVGFGLALTYYIRRMYSLGTNTLAYFMCCSIDDNCLFYRAVLSSMLMLWQNKLACFSSGKTSLMSVGCMDKQSSSFCHSISFIELMTLVHVINLFCTCR
jgi:hypothetical protein